MGKAVDQAWWVLGALGAGVGGRSVGGWRAGPGSSAAAQREEAQRGTEGERRAARAAAHACCVQRRASPQLRGVPHALGGHVEGGRHLLNGGGGIMRGRGTGSGPGREGAAAVRSVRVRCPSWQASAGAWRPQRGRPQQERTRPCNRQCSRQMHHATAGMQHTTRLDKVGEDVALVARLLVLALLQKERQKKCSETGDLWSPSPGIALLRWG